LTNILCLNQGDIVFVHSSIDRLGLGFPFFGILSILRQVIGESGTLVFPTYPRVAAHEALLSGEVFDVRSSPSYTGILTEFARRQSGALRSLNPTKSVVALGPRAAELTSNHQNSPYPFDRDSPYYHLTNWKSKVVGLGVSTHSMSFVHCVEDYLKDAFPMTPDFPELFEGRCRDYDGRIVQVPSYAHDPAKMKARDIRAFLRTQVRGRYEDVYADIELDGMAFFWASPGPLFEIMIDLARRGLTVYDRSVYDK
jgi:aminoglycoside N3'-acetyltransferase